MIIPMEPLPNQSFNINLNGQDCRFEFVTRLKNIFMNLSVNNEPILNGIICLNGVNLIPEKYIKFNGSLYFQDLEGSLDPYFWGLGSRWVLNYV